MEDQKSLQDEIDILMKKKGNTKGSELITFARYIEEKYGKDGVKAIETKLRELGYPFKFDDVKALGEWYPEALNVSAILIARDLFKWTKSDFFKFGYDSPKYSFLVKVLIKYFVTLKTFESESRTYWSKFMDFGELEWAEINEAKKYVVLRLKGYDMHPDMCEYYRGFFLKMSENVVKGENVKVEETRCIYKGDPYHELLVTWE